ncbi:MAG: hypothetical protein IK115_11985 [Lachnospiraceae bacterium]|nr:hypothetical protein [Lachnospiraceae bacterium]
MDTYSDIIDHPHYQSKTRPHMSMSGRAAQFAPFAALSGYGDAVRETERETDPRVELDESELALLNDKLQYLYLCRADHPRVTIRYFVKDRSKDGGSYESITGTVKNIDAVFCYVVMDDDSLIPIRDIRSIEL